MKEIMMFRQTLIATVVVFILWSIIDFLVHGMLLQASYQATSHLWRPEDQAHMWLMSAVTLIFSFCVVSIYSYFIAPKSLRSGTQYGLLLGIGVGCLTGLGTYSYMPIPMELASSWFAVNFVELTVAGIIAGSIIKEPVTEIGGGSLGQP
jgi:Na+/H+ antiporter NhaA